MEQLKVLLIIRLILVFFTWREYELTGPGESQPAATSFRSITWNSFKMSKEPSFN